MYMLIISHDFNRLIKAYDKRTTNYDLLSCWLVETQSRDVHRSFMSLSYL